jgi:hypothetical protein
MSRSRRGSRSSKRSVSAGGNADVVSR